MSDLVKRLRGLRCFGPEHFSLLIEAADRIEAFEAELLEQARLLGMGSEREARLLARVEELERVCAMALEALEEAKNNDDSMSKWDRHKAAISSIRKVIGEKA